MSRGPHGGRGGCDAGQFLGSGRVNAALISVYFVLIWGDDAVRALTSPFHGFEDPAHATAASYFRNLFDFNLDGLIRTAQVLAGIKLVVAVRVRRLSDRFFARTLDAARAEPRNPRLGAAVRQRGDRRCGPGRRSAAEIPGLIRLHATQFLLLTGAMIVVVVERQIEEMATLATRSNPPQSPISVPAGVALPRPAHRPN